MGGVGGVAHQKIGNIRSFSLENYKIREIKKVISSKRYQILKFFHLMRTHKT